MGSYDKSIGLLCKFLTYSCNDASTKILPMISPILQKWLSFSSNDDRLKKLIHSRAAVSILACFTLDDVQSRGSSDHACLNDDMKRLLVSGMVFQFEESS